jgi:uncharacterized protein
VRRHEQEIPDKSSLEEILRQAQLLRLGLCRDNEPYVVPVLFGYRDGHLYIHSSPEGAKIDILRHNSRVCFETEVNVELVKDDVPCKWSLRYRSVIGWGNASFVEDEAGKTEALGILMEHYSGTTDHEYSPPLLAKTAVIKIEIEKMTGKRSKQ